MPQSHRPTSSVPGRRVRQPAVAGKFYPADPDDLALLVDQLLDTVPGSGEAGGAAADVVPHAGDRYSGPTAAHAYAGLRGTGPGTVVLLGPAPYVPGRGAVAPAAPGLGPPPGGGPAGTRP